MGLAHLIKLIVFDLDYTLWPFWVDTHVSPPFRKISNADVIDFYGSKIRCYPEVPDILKDLNDTGYTLAVASRTSEIKGAQQLMQLFGWNKYFQHKQIFPGSKVAHFKNLKSQSGVPFNQMLFYDDEHCNIKDVTGLGVVSILVDEKIGITKQLIKNGELEFIKQRSKN